MSKAILIHEYGGPEVLKWEDHDPGNPVQGQVRIRQSAAGLNFRDVYHRNGSYGVPGNKFPAVIGGDGAGVIEAVGIGVEDFRVGDRVAYGNGPMGSYTEVRNFPAENLFKLPDAVEEKTAAALLVKGFTARYLIHDCYPVGPNDTILVHSISGGTGLIMCQWAKRLGARVIGTVSTEEKAALAESYGCDHVILYKEDVAARVRELTDGEGVPVVYDGVGKDTFETSLDCLRVRGYLVGYGNASGNFPVFDPLTLMQKGSLYFTRVSGRDFAFGREHMVNVANEMFSMVMEGDLRLEVNTTYALSDAQQAHRDLEARKTTGSVVYEV